MLKLPLSFPILCGKADQGPPVGSRENPALRCFEGDSQTSVSVKGILDDSIGIRFEFRNAPNNLLIPFEVVFEFRSGRNKDLGHFPAPFRYKTFFARR